MTEYFTRQPASAHSHPRCLCEAILGRSISGVMCLLDYSRDQTTERGEEAAERVADWEQSLSERWQSGDIRLHQLEAAARQTQLGVSRTCVHTLGRHLRHNNGKPDTLSSSTVRPEAEPQRLSVGYVWRCDAWGRVWAWEECVWMRVGDRGVSCNFLRFGCRRFPTVLCLLCYRDSAAWICSLHPTGRSFRVFLDWRWRSTHSGLLMRKAQRTQKFSRHYSLTFARFAGDAAARRSCSRGVVRARQAPPGAARGRGVTLVGSLVMCAPSKRIRLRPPPLVLRPPLWAAGWVCGGNETMALFSPRRHLHYETLTTTGAPGMSVRQAVRKRKSEMGRK